MERKQVTLSELCIKKLKMMSKATGLSASELIRNAVDVYWEKIMPIKGVVKKVGNIKKA